MPRKRTAPLSTREVSSSDDGKPTSKRAKQMNTIDSNINSPPVVGPDGGNDLVVPATTVSSTEISSIKEENDMVEEVQEEEEEEVVPSYDTSHIVDIPSAIRSLGAVSHYFHAFIVVDKLRRFFYRGCRQGEPISEEALSNIHQFVDLGGLSVLVCALLRFQHVKYNNHNLFIDEGLDTLEVIVRRCNENQDYEWATKLDGSNFLDSLYLLATKHFPKAIQVQSPTVSIIRHFLHAAKITNNIRIQSQLKQEHIFQFMMKSMDDYPKNDQIVFCASMFFLCMSEVITMDVKEQLLQMGVGSALADAHYYHIGKKGDQFFRPHIVETCQKAITELMKLTPIMEEEVDDAGN